MSLATWITGLSPFGPIFGKELRVASRRKRNHLLRVVYIGGMLLFLLAFYLSLPSSRYSQMNVAYRIQQQAQLGQTFFAIFGIFCICCMGLIAPVLTSTAINSERLGKTLGVLLMTPITSWQIVSGKLFARLLIAFLLIGLSLPVLALVRLLGGVEVSQMVAVICLCTVFAMSCGALGLFYSTVVNRAYAVILLSYATMFAIYFLAPMFVMVLSGRGGGSPRVLQGIMTFNPVMNVGMLTIPEAFMFSMGWLGQWLPGVLVQLGLTFALLCASAASLRRVARHAGERPMAVPIPPAVEATTAAIQPAVRNAGTVGDNPVLWREIRRPLTAGWRGPVAGLVVSTLLLISYAVFAEARVLDEEDLQVGYAVVFNGLYWLLIAVLSATAIAQEKESDTWTLLLATPIGGDAIVMGKLFGIARRMLWPTLLIALHFAIFTLGSVISTFSFLIVLWVIFTFNTVWAATGLFLSLYVRKVTTAVVINLMLTVTLFVGTPIMLLILGQLMWGTERWMESAGWYMPYPFLASAVESFSPNFDWARTAWYPTGGRGLPIEFITVVGMIGIAHILVAGVVILIIIANFDRLVGRAPQQRRQGPRIPPSLSPHLS